MATNNYALTTKERIKARLGITVTGFDTVLDRLIYSMTDFLEGKCERRFLKTVYTQEIYDGSYATGQARKVLTLRNAPLISIEAFQYRTGAKSNPDWVDFQTDQYQERYDTATIFGYMPLGFQNIRISYTAGYLFDWTNENDPSKHTLPYDITDLCERLVIRLFKKRESEGRSNESVQGSSITWASDLLDPQDKQIIGNYTLYKLA